MSKYIPEAEYTAMSDACQKIICLDKAIRDMIGRNFYPVTIWANDRSSKDCTQMDGSHNLKNFDYILEEINARLENREKTGKKITMSQAHNDYIKTVEHWKVE